METATTRTSEPEIVRAINAACIDKLTGNDPRTYRQAVEALSDFLQVKAREDRFTLPAINSPQLHPEGFVAGKALAVVHGIAVFRDDLEGDADVRQVLCDRLAAIQAGLGPVERIAHVLRPLEPKARILTLMKLPWCLYCGRPKTNDGQCPCSAPC
jgi:hypothetical protein